MKMKVATMCWTINFTFNALDRLQVFQQERKKKWNKKTPAQPTHKITESSQYFLYTHTMCFIPGKKAFISNLLVFPQISCKKTQHFTNTETYEVLIIFLWYKMNGEIFCLKFQHMAQYQLTNDNFRWIANETFINEHKIPPPKLLFWKFMFFFRKHDHLCL